MIRESGLVFPDLEPEAVDMPFGAISGAGVIFGITGGVTEAVLRRLSPDKSSGALRTIAYTGIRGMQGSKQALVRLGGREVKIAVVSGLANAGELIERIREGERYDFVEVMACPGGCINGGGQPFADAPAREDRGRLLYAADKMSNNKRSEENPLMMTLYTGPLRGKVRELLHVRYRPEGRGG